MSKYPVIGILGGGQLAQMLALSGYPLGLRFKFYDPVNDACAGLVGDLTVASYSDKAALEVFAKSCDFITYDFENVPVVAAKFVSAITTVFPHANVLEITQDRLKEKLLFKSLNLPVADFYPIGSYAELLEAVKTCKFNGFLKTRTLGYDGKGQYRITKQTNLKKLWNAISDGSYIFEKGIDFIREISVLIVRNKNADVRVYEHCENKHKNGILATTLVPAKTSQFTVLANQYAKKIAEKLNYVGLLAVEMFETDDGLLINEVAPRVHNSGHWSIEGALTSQFENHLRAGLGMSLGETSMSQGYSAMINWIGEIPKCAYEGKQKGVFWHIYGKENRVGRKVGHSTVVADNTDDLHAKLIKLVEHLTH